MGTLQYSSLVFVVISIKIVVQKISDSNQVPQKAEQLVKENVRFSIINLNCIYNNVSVLNDDGTFDASPKTTS